MQTNTFDDELVTIIAEDYGTDVPLPQLYAHFFTKTASKPAELVLSESPSLTSIYKSFPVSGKVEARRIANQNNAIVWNF